MHVHEALRTMAAAAGLSHRAIAAAAGHSATWYTTVLQRGDGTAAATVATVASACGYTLACVPSSVPLPCGALVIDARTTAQTTDKAQTSTS